MSCAYLLSTRLRRMAKPPGRHRRCGTKSSRFKMRKHISKGRWRHDYLHHLVRSMPHGGGALELEGQKLCRGLLALIFSFPARWIHHRIVPRTGKAKVEPRYWLDLGMLLCHNT